MDAATMTALDPAKQGPLSNEPSAAEMLRQNLEEKHLALLSRRDQLLAAVKRAPSEVADEETAAKYADFIEQVGKASKVADKTREAEKAPHLEAGRTVDGWFRAIIDPLDRVHAALKARQKKYLDAKAAAARKAADEQARREREEAERLAATAQTDEQLNEAIAHEMASQEAAAVAAAKPAELSRVRGEYGSVSSLKTFWTYQIVDEGLVPREYMILDDDAIKVAIKAARKDGDKIDLAIPGIRIYQDTRL